jgi:hypothetical protein
MVATAAVIPTAAVKYPMDFPAATAIAAVASVAAIPAAAAPTTATILASATPISAATPGAGATPVAITPAAVTIASAAPAVLWEHTKMAVRERRVSARTLGLMVFDLEKSLWTRRIERLSALHPLEIVADLDVINTRGENGLTLTQN